MGLKVFNTLGRKLEEFVPLSSPHVGMYVCGPTVYSHSHLGHAKSYVSFDVIVRWLRCSGYDVTYVQNITDVGHMTNNDEDAGEDPIVREARRRSLHPMAIVETFMRSYLEDMDALNVLRPDIMPRATGHIPEQIELVKRLLAGGHAYEVNGSVYFDVTSDRDYGKLSGRRVAEMEAGARVAVNEEKRNPADFALWKRAEAGHIMRWPSPWGEGFPGWHLECSVMSQKYLGDTLDIHGGGIENQFPHHECEIAQSECATGRPFVRYWLHNNMCTINGQKMGKSLGNSVYLKDLFDLDRARSASEGPIGARSAAERPIGARSASEGPIGARSGSEGPIRTRSASEGPIGARSAAERPIRARSASEGPAQPLLDRDGRVLLERRFEPAVVRHFILTSHYRTPLDFSNEALKAAEAGSYKLRDAVRELAKAAAAGIKGSRHQGIKVYGSEPEGSEPGAQARGPALPAADVRGISEPERQRGAAGATALEQCVLAAKSEAVRAALTDVTKRFADAMNEDFNTAAAIAAVFDFTKLTSTWVREAAPAEDVRAADTLMQRLVGDALGLKWQDPAAGAAAETERDALIQVLVDLRNDARQTKNFALSDQIRARLTALGVELKDTAQGTTW